MTSPPNPTTWTDLDLEAYFDAQLPAHQAGPLAESLLHDADLRARLSAIRAADAAVLAAATPHPHATHATRAPRRHASRAWPLAITHAMAATLALVAGLLISRWHPQPAPVVEPAHTELAPPVTTPDAPFRVAAAADSTLLRTSLGPARPRPDAAPARPPARRQTVAPTATPAAAIDPLFIVGLRLRSSDEARAALDVLDPHAQLRACAIWARIPRTRPIAFERLAALATHPALSDELTQTFRTLSADPELIPWLRMHALVSEPHSPIQ